MKMGVSTKVADYETAFIFGAGASVPLLPDQQQLIPRLWKATTPPYSSELPLHLLLPARQYLLQTFPGLPMGTKITFEDVVGPLEISESEEYWFHYAYKDKKTGHLITNQAVLDALDLWLAIALNPSNLPRRPGDPGFSDHFSPAPTSRVLYAQLFNLLDNLGLTNRCVFVSLNYDTLLDKSILATEKYDTDYQIEAFVDRPPTGKGLPVLKLHGSLNWRSCDSCHVLLDLRYEYIGPRSHCQYCGERQARPMLIRPTLLKDFRHRVWQDVWRAAGRALAGATRWVIIGYSLPLADVWMLRLLAQSIRSGKRRERQVIVINPERDVLDRFRLLFPSACRGSKTFEEYIDACRAAGRLV
jgi:hypothetical protein